MKRVLLLGGTGAMGGYLSRILANSGEWDVWITSRSSRDSECRNIHFIQGNARDDSFLHKVLQQEKFEAIVDFMNYDYEEFVHRSRTLLYKTAHYVWFSSCRVYADSFAPLTEKSPRLLEISEDDEFLSTNRYALRKARQEDILKKSGLNNYTIIRPYITYSSERLQLGIYEKEQWLWRLLQGKKLVINKNILNKTTSLTYGGDVAAVIAHLIGNSKAHGKIVQIASPETKKWSEILSIYSDILTRYTGKRPEVYLCDFMQSVDELYEGGYNTVYDRVYNRRFDSSYVEKLLGKKVQYTGIETGLRGCLKEFLSQKKAFLHINPQYEAYQDLLTGETCSIESFPSSDLYYEYQRYRQTPISALNMNPTLISIP